MGIRLQWTHPYIPTALHLHTFAAHWPFGSQNEKLCVQIKLWSPNEYLCLTKSQKKSVFYASWGGSVGLLLQPLCWRVELISTPVWLCPCASTLEAQFDLLHLHSMEETVQKSLIDCQVARKHPNRLREISRVHNLSHRKKETSIGLFKPNKTRIWFCGTCERTQAWIFKISQHPHWFPVKIMIASGQNELNLWIDIVRHVKSTL